MPLTGDAEAPGSDLLLRLLTARPVKVREREPHAEEATVEVGVALQALHDSLHPFGKGRAVFVYSTEDVGQCLWPALADGARVEALRWRQIRCAVRGGSTLTLS